MCGHERVGMHDYLAAGKTVARTAGAYTGAAMTMIQRINASRGRPTTRITRVYLSNYCNYGRSESWSDSWICSWYSGAADGGWSNPHLFWAWGS